MDFPPDAGPARNRPEADCNSEATLERRSHNLGMSVASRNRHTTTLLISDFADIDLPILEVASNVLNPAEGFSGQYFARALPRLTSFYAGRRVLDLGCGSGILGVVAGLHGALELTFADINADAVRNAASNASRYDLPFTAIASDLFDAIAERFDVILFNPPGMTGDPRNDPVLGAIFSHDRLLERFFAEFPSRLRHNGAVLMPTSSGHTLHRRPDYYATTLGMNVELLDCADSTIGTVQSIFAIRPSYG